MPRCSSQVVQFFEGKTIFITGGTGFIGKLIIEKIFTSCPGIKRIYVLIRPKRGQDKAERLNNITNSQAFQDLKEHHPEQLDKLEALEGDLELPGLGLSPADRELLAEVNVVFNVAATINFNEELKKSLVINVLATKTLLQMCLKIKNLKSFVHVSTAYGNCDMKHIDERIYESSVDVNKLLKECEQCSSERDVKNLTKRVLGNKPNTYTLTKAMAENVVEQYGRQIPIGIVRPSIVTAALRSPFPGWVDSRSGATSIASVIGSGLLRIVRADDSIIIDMVPVDLVSNAIIVAAWKTSLVGKARDPIVYNVTSGRRHPVTFGEFRRWITKHSKMHPQDNVVWYPSTCVTKNRLLLFFGHFWMHLVPAYLHDTFVPSSRTVRLVKAHRRLRKVTEALQYFMTRSFDFADDNFNVLRRQMGEEDSKIFYLDVKHVVWGQYFEQYVIGIRKYILGQADGTVTRAKERMHKIGATVPDPVPPASHPSSGDIRAGLRRPPPQPAKHIGAGHNTELSAPTTKDKAPFLG